MKRIPVFRQGKWIHYTVPLSCTWSREQMFRAASAYATALQKGYSEQESLNLAEMLIHKEVYPGIQYSETLEKKCRTLMDPVEIT